MKKKIISTLLLGCILTTSMVSATAFATKTVDATKINTKANQFELVQTLKADVLGDSNIDEVSLLAKKHPESSVYFESMKVSVKDGKTGKVYTHDLNGGYEPVLFLGDFNGDKKSDIMIQSDTGGSGGIRSVQILSVKDNKFVSLMDSESEDFALKFNYNFKDNFKASILNENTKSTFDLDLKGLKADLVESEAYNKDGKLLKKDMGWTDGIKYALPADLNGDGVYELLCNTSILGESHVDKLSNVNWTYQYDAAKKTWVVVDLDMSTPVFKSELIKY